ncbi:MAG TPA: hypothetical protein QGH10_26450, partial [Armatimonadota bacterium]|nr:hypothetical protein [Armatimonadota bacterium]
MKQTRDLAELQWTLEGHTPYLWLLEWVHGAGFGAEERCIDVRPVPATVPGSVQGALREAGIIPDWNSAVNSRESEWVENRHWMYRTRIPAEWLDPDKRFRLECQGLDYAGWIYINGQEVGAFRGTHVPHEFDITPYLNAAENELDIIFDLAPRWLGQFGYTSQMREWKTRFNYTWDWTPRLVQVGIWDSISLVASSNSEFGTLRCLADADPKAGHGILELAADITEGGAETARISLEGDGGPIRCVEVTVAEFAQGITWSELPVQLWWPNLQGEQPLYTVTCVLLDAQGAELDRETRRVGFKHVEWVPCEGAPAEADP